MNSHVDLRVHGKILLAFAGSTLLFWLAINVLF
jgi:hypothetical protein